MALLKRKRKVLRKGSRAIGSAVCLLFLTLMAAGCGKVEEPIPVQLSSGNAEELQNGAVEESEGDPEDASVGAPKVNEGDDMDENGQQPEAVQPQSVGSAELEGNVRSIEADSFVVVRDEVWSEGNASYAVGAAPGYEDEEDLITVHVNQKCVWEFKTVKNGGINPEDISTREGSFSDLKEGISIRMKGNWQDDGSFLSDSIVMMIFV